MFIHKVSAEHPEIMQFLQIQFLMPCALIGRLHYSDDPTAVLRLGGSSVTIFLGLLVSALLGLHVTALVSARTSL